MNRLLWEQVKHYLGGDWQTKQDHAKAMENLDRVEVLLRNHQEVVLRARAAREYLAKGRWDGYEAALSQLWAEIDRQYPVEWEEP